MTLYEVSIHSRKKKYKEKTFLQRKNYLLFLIIYKKKQHLSQKKIIFVEEALI